MRFLTRSLTGVFLLALTVGLLVAGGYTIRSAIAAREANAPGARMAAERVFAATVLALDYGPVVPVLTAYGEVTGLRQLELRATRGGTIVELSPAFVEGGTVAAGDLLVKLDPTEAEAARDSAAASLAEAEASQALAGRSLAIATDDLAAAGRQRDLKQKALDRQLALNARGLGTDAATETAELTLSSAEQAVLTKRAALSSSEAQQDQAANALRRATIALSEAERELAETEIRAGFDGVLSGVGAVSGGLVSANEKLADLIDPAALEVAFRVSTNQFSRLLDAKGNLIEAELQVYLESEGVAIPATARLMRAGAAVENGLTGRVLYARVTEGAGALRPGDFVTLRLNEPELQNVAQVPASAVDAGGKVLVLADDSRLREAPVEVLRRQGDAVIIRADLPAGTEIVAERTPLLGEGIKLRPMRAGADAVSAEPEMITLDPERRARLIAFVEGNTRMPEERKKSLLAQLAAEKVPADVVAQLEQRIGG